MHRLVDSILISGSAVAAYMVLTMNYGVSELPALGIGIAVGVIISFVMYEVS